MADRPYKVGDRVVEAFSNLWDEFVRTTGIDRFTRADESSQNQPRYGFGATLEEAQGDAEHPTGTGQPSSTWSKPSQNRPITEEELEVIEAARELDEFNWPTKPRVDYRSPGTVVAQVLERLHVAIKKLPQPEPEKMWLMVAIDGETLAAKIISESVMKAITWVDADRTAYFGWDETTQAWGRQLTEKEVAELRGES